MVTVKGQFVPNIVVKEPLVRLGRILANFESASLLLSLLKRQNRKAEKRTVKSGVYCWEGKISKN